MDFDELKSSNLELYYDAMAKMAIYEAVLKLRGGLTVRIENQTIDRGLFTTFENLYNLFVNSNPSEKIEKFEHFEGNLDHEVTLILEAHGKN